MRPLRGVLPHNACRLGCEELRRVAFLAQADTVAAPPGFGLGFAIGFAVGLGLGLAFGFRGFTRGGDPSSRSCPQRSRTAGQSRSQRDHRWGGPRGAVG